MNPLLLLLVLAMPQDRIGDAPRPERLERPLRGEAVEPEGLFFNLGPARFRDAGVFALGIRATDLTMNTSDLGEFVSDGTSSPPKALFEFEEMHSFQALGAGVEVDFRLFRISASVFQGDWEGEGTLVVDDGFLSVTRTPVDVEGDLMGAKFAIEWPLLRWRSPGFDFSLGPELAALWLHEEFDPVPGTPLPFDDELDQLVGSIAPKLRLGPRFGRLDLHLDLTTAYLFGHARGWGADAAFGLSFRF